MKKLIISATFFGILGTTNAQVTSGIWQLPTGTVVTSATSNAYRSGNLGLGTTTAPTAKLQLRQDITGPIHSPIFPTTPDLRIDRFASSGFTTGWWNITMGTSSPSDGTSLFFQNGAGTSAASTAFQLTPTNSMLFRPLFLHGNFQVLSNSNQVVKATTTGEVTAQSYSLSSYSGSSSALRLKAGDDGSYIELNKSSVSQGNGEVTFVSRPTNGTGGTFNFIANTYGTSNWPTLMKITPTTITNSNGTTTTYGKTELTGELVIKGLNSNTTGDNEFRVNTNGEVFCRRIRVNLTTIPDYVFEPDYNLMPLNTLKTFVEKEKHLPNISSAKEYEEKGNIDLTELNLKLLEKIEELTLYLFQQQEEIEKLKSIVHSKN